MQGPYGKLWIEFFPSFYGPSAKRAGHENKEGKNEVAVSEGSTVTCHDPVSCRPKKIPVTRETKQSATFGVFCMSIFKFTYIVQSRLICI